MSRLTNVLRLAGGNSQRRFLVAVVGGSVLLGAGGMIGTAFVKSPQEAAADAGPPEPSLLTAMVEERVLADTVVVRGAVTASRSVDVSARVSVDGAPVVTGVRAGPGDEIGVGDVLVEVSGRPVILLRGDVPAYRAIRPGAEGDDVTQLQQALSDLGFDTTGDEAGVFGDRTQAALADFYASIGYTVATTGDEDGVVAAEQAVVEAERGVEEAREALELAEDRRDALRKAAADAASAAADADHAADAAESAVAEDPDDEDLAAEAEQLRTTADQLAGEAVAASEAATLAAGEPDPVEAARRQVDRANEDLTFAQDARTQAATTSGPVLPVGEYVFAPTVPARVEEIAVAVGDEPTGALATLSSGELLVEAVVSLSVVGLLAEGMAAQILSELTGFESEAMVQSIGEPVQTGVPVTIVTDTQLPPDLVGADVRVTVTAAQTDGAVLVVPVSAISSTAEGASIVVRLDDSGADERVEVIAGVSGNGFVEVTPALSGALVAGDRVVTGQ